MRRGLKEAGIVIPPEPGIESLYSYNGLLAASREHASKKSKEKTTVSTFANILDNAVEKILHLTLRFFRYLCHMIPLFPPNGQKSCSILLFGKLKSAQSPEAASRSICGPAPGLCGTRRLSRRLDLSGRLSAGKQHPRTP